MSGPEGSWEGRIESCERRCRAKSYFHDNPLYYDYCFERCMEEAGG